MKKKIKTKKFKNLKEFLETCSEDEKEYIYDLYNNASVADLIDLLFEHLPAENTIQEILELREEQAEWDKTQTEWDDAEAERLNNEKV